MIPNGALRPKPLLLLATLALMPTIACAAQPSMLVAREGKAACLIAVGSDASPVEQTAARELADYLHKVTGQLSTSPRLGATGSERFQPIRRSIGPSSRASWVVW